MAVLPLCGLAALAAGLPCGATDLAVPSAPPAGPPATPIVAEPVMAEPVMAEPVMAEPVMVEPVMVEPRLVAFVYRPPQEWAAPGPAAPGVGISPVAGTLARPAVLAPGIRLSAVPGPAGHSTFPDMALLPEIRFNLEPAWNPLVRRLDDLLSGGGTALVMDMNLDMGWNLRGDRLSMSVETDESPLRFTGKLDLGDQQMMVGLALDF